MNANESHSMKPADLDQKWFELLAYAAQLDGQIAGAAALLSDAVALLDKQCATREEAEEDLLRWGIDPLVRKTAALMITTASIAEELKGFMVSLVAETISFVHGNNVGGTESKGVERGTGSEEDEPNEPDPTIPEPVIEDIANDRGIGDVTRQKASKTS